jgi:DNA (cytosine-5)-methyltransferase 1
VRVGSLFSGCGGMDLGLEQAGMKTIWQVENNEFCQQLLQRHFPHSKKYLDIKTVKGKLDKVDLICGGFPCQDISLANHNGKGLEGERSGLWRYFRDIICELQPRYALIENVPNLVNKGLETVLCDLAELGFDA